MIEVGCGPSVAARAVAERVVPSGHVLAIDHSDKAIAIVRQSSTALISAGRLTPRRVAIDELDLELGEEPVRRRLSVRVGAFDGRNPVAGSLGLARHSRALIPGGPLFIDGGDPLQEITMPRTN